MVGNSIVIEKTDDIPKHDSIKLHGERRLTKWDLQREAQALLPDERVAFCMHRLQGTAVDIVYSPQHQSAYYSGLMTCGSVWVCPVCAAKIAERRRLEIEQAINGCINTGGVVYLATYTIAHKRYDTLSSLLYSFLAARKRTRQGRGAQKLRERFGLLGTITVREVTWSKLNGWHPHSHELIFFAHEIDADAYAKASREQWEKSVEHEGLSVNEHGFRLDRTHGAVADYIAKFGREPHKAVWGISAELTKGYMKHARQEEHLTPFAMLGLIAQGRDELKPLFREYAQWFKGKHQLVWSSSLRAQLLGNTDEQSDEEIAQEEEEETVLLGQLSRDEWMTVVKQNAQGKLLEVASFGDWHGVIAFLQHIGVVPGKAPPY